MKQVYLHFTGGARPELRSDTLFGLIAWGVRAVYGRDSVERFLEPLYRTPAEAPLVLTSAFPYVETAEGRLHYFPRPAGEGTGVGQGWIEDRELLAYVSGRPLADSAVERVDGDGLFFLAAGPQEHYLEAALGFLERFGLSGRGSSGGGAVRVEMKEAEFLRLAQEDELALLLSLWFPTADERRRLAESVAAGRRVRYAMQRRRGAAGGRFLDLERPFKRPVAMLREGSVLPYPSRRSAGASPVVGRGSDDDGEFPIHQHGFGFFVPITGEAP